MQIKKEVILSLAKNHHIDTFLGVRMLGIISSFDGGNIEVVKADDPSDIQLKIRSDTNADFFQWFYFRVVGVRGSQCSIKI